MNIQNKIKISIQHFIDFCNKNFLLGPLAHWVSDNRKKPRIHSVSIFFNLFLMGALGLPSLLQLDLLLRNKRPLPSLQPASDSTFTRTLALMSLYPLRLILKSISLKVIDSGKGKVELPKVGRVKVGIVDGTTFGKMYASVISIPGQVDIPIDIEPWEGRGKELPSSQRLLERFLQTYGKGFVDYMVADGLYATRDFFSFCIEKLSCHGVVKTEEERLQVIDFAEGLFKT